MVLTESMVAILSILCRAEVATKSCTLSATIGITKFVSISEAIRCAFGAVGRINCCGAFGMARTFTHAHPPTYFFGTDAFLAGITLATLKVLLHRTTSILLGFTVVQAITLVGTIDQQCFETVQ